MKGKPFGGHLQCMYIDSS